MRDLQKRNIIERLADNESVPLRVIEMDVNDEDSVERTIMKIIDKEKRIDILVNNAGYGLFGAYLGLNRNSPTSWLVIFI